MSTIPQLSAKTELTMAALTVAGIFVGSKLLPEMRLATTALDDTEGLGLGLAEKSAVPSLADFQMAMARRGLSTAELTGGSALGGEATVPSFGHLQAEMARKGLTGMDIAGAEADRNYINSGWYGDVYKIPKLPDYVLKVPRESAILQADKFKLVPVEDPAPGLNFGQPVAKVGDSQILKKVPGEAYGVGNTSGYTRQELADFHAEDVRMAAAMPQSAYDHLAQQLKAAEQHGLWFDSDNPENILVDSKRQLFHPVDFQRVENEPLARHTLNDMLYPLMDPPRTGLPAPTGWVPAAGNHAIEGPDFLRWHGEPDPLQAEYRTIVDKSFTAAKNAGLDIRQNPNLDNLMHNAGVSDKEYEKMFRSLHGRG